MFKMDVNIQVKVKPWLKNPKLLYNKALTRAGLAWQVEARKYPPSPPNVGFQGTGTRTGNLAKKAAFSIVLEGQEMHLLGPKYYLYLLLGTGIYGPRGTPIIGNPFLVWRVTDMSHPLAGQLIKAHSIRGTIWDGKREAVMKAMREGFLEGLRMGREQMT